MKNLLFVFALLFFAPVQNFAIVSHNTETAIKQTETAKKQQKTEAPKKSKWLNLCLSAATGFIIGGYLIIKATPIFAAVCLGIGLIFCIISIVLIVKQIAKSE